MVILRRLVAITLVVICIWCLSANITFGRIKQRSGAGKSRQQHTSRERKQNRYTSTHDINGDGNVNAKDRLLWINKNKGNYDKVLVSTENEDLVEAMDYDGDGDVESAEMELFYSNYDLNGDGALSEAEIEAASE